MNDLNRHCANFLHPFSSSFYVKVKVKLNDIAQTWWGGGWSCVELDNDVHPSPLQTPQMQVQEFWPKCAHRHPLLLPNIQQSTQNNSVLGICACSVFFCAGILALERVPSFLYLWVNYALLCSVLSSSIAEQPIFCGVQTKHTPGTLAENYLSLKRLSPIKTRRTMNSNL